jgi:hypothetical protein
VENSAIENMLVNGKKINKGANEEDYDTGWYHVICEGSFMSTKFMSMAILIIVANVCGLLVSLR